MNIKGMRLVCALGLVFCLGGCGAPGASSKASAEMPRGIVQKNQPKDGQAEIYLAGGCFWGTELYTSLVYGVISAESGLGCGDSTMKCAGFVISARLRRAGLPHRMNASGRSRAPSRRMM